LSVNGEVLATADAMYSARGDDLVTLKLDKPYRIEKGASRIFELKATVV
jgi:hypothetical protein